MDKSQKNTKNHAALMYNLNQAPRMERLIQPLKDYTGVHIFSYGKIYSSGEIHRLSNHSIWTKEFFRKEYYNHATLYMNYIKRAPLYTWQHHLLAGIPHGEHQKNLYAHGIWNVFYMYKRGIASTELFAFGAHPDNDGICNVYLQESEIFRAFMANFANQTKDLLGYNREINIHTNLDYPLSEPEKQNSFRPKRFFIDETTYLTNREIECLKGISEGMSLGQIAEKQSISYRTVESHINSIKVKAGVSSKDHLLDKIGWIVR